MDIQPGSRVKVMVKSTLKTTRARKTLARLFIKDRAVRKVRRTQPKPVISSRRAGRLWHNRPEGSNLRPPAVGDSANIVATVDVIQDLQSVAKYIDVN